MLRKTMFTILTLAVMFLGLAVGRGEAAPKAQATAVKYFVVNLSGTNEVPATSSAGTGQAYVVFDSSAGTLSWHLSVQNLTGITGAHIHAGLPGENGGVVFPLYTGSGTFDSTHPIHGVITLSQAQATALESGQYYVNIHTEANPGGEIRGQLVQQFIMFLPTLFHQGQ